ncbi:MAG: hypothetical protein IJR92_01900 [Alphaproteobacteria bacterium]|nr:hypothetical protein [Alphaproteobacteria bacterium]
MLQNNTNQKQSLNKQSVNIIKTAYMDLFNGLVQIHCDRGIPHGAAWYKALGQIYEILAQRKKKLPGFVFNHLASFFNSHRKTLLKKSMVSRNKNNIELRKPNNQIANERELIKTFDNKIYSVINKQHMPLAIIINAFNQNNARVHKL